MWFKKEGPRPACILCDEDAGLVHPDHDGAAAHHDDDRDEADDADEGVEGVGALRRNEWEGCCEFARYGGRFWWSDQRGTTGAMQGIK